MISCSMRRKGDTSTLKTNGGGFYRIPKRHHFANSKVKNRGQTFK